MMVITCTDEIIIIINTTRCAKVGGEVKATTEHRSQTLSPSWDFSVQVRWSQSCVNQHCSIVSMGDLCLCMPLNCIYRVKLCLTISRIALLVTVNHLPY